MTDIIQPSREFYREDVEKRLHQPIPLGAGEVAGWQEVPISEAKETLVALGPFSREAGTVLTSSVYYGEHSSSPYIYERNELSGALLSLFVREKVAKRIMEAQQILPDGHHLLVFDAYRPVRVQQSLYSLYRSQLVRQRPDMTVVQLDAETQKYVSMPSLDPARPSPHNTGGSVDLAIIRMAPEHEEMLRLIDDQLFDGDLDIGDRVVLEMKKSAIIRQHSVWLDFGTAFDHGGEKASLTYFEQKLARGESLSHEEQEACRNRRLLYNVMTQVGMQPYYAEWWHYNAPESQMGAQTAGNGRATYGAAEFDINHSAHEELRQELYQRIVDLQERRMGIESYTPSTDDMEVLLLETLEMTGEPRLASQWPTEVIAPQFVSSIHN